MSLDNRYFKTPNCLIDLYWFYLTDEEGKVLMVMHRFTQGYEKTQEHISLSRIQKKTGLTTGAIRKALDGLITYRFIVQLQPPQKADRIAALWEIDPNYPNVDLAGLKKRDEEKRKQNQRRTEKARHKKSGGQNGSANGDAQASNTVLSDNAHPLLPDNNDLSCYTEDDLFCGTEYHWSVALENKKQSSKNNTLKTGGNTRNAHAREREQGPQATSDSAINTNPENHKPVFYDEEVQSIFNAYPKKTYPPRTKQEIKDALQRLANGEDFPAWLSKTCKPINDPAGFLLSRVKMYAWCVRHEPMRFIPESPNWFEGGRYLEEEEVWTRSPKDEMAIRHPMRLAKSDGTDEFDEERYIRMTIVGGQLVVRGAGAQKPELAKVFDYLRKRLPELTSNQADTHSQTEADDGSEHVHSSSSNDPDWWMS